MDKKVYTILFFFLLALSSTAVLSQQDDYINGTLLDAKLNEPIAFATIRIKGRALGVVSNVDGGFRIPLKFKEYGDVLEISSMGYESKSVLLQSLTVNGLNRITLKPALQILSEVVVSGKRKSDQNAQSDLLSATEIVRKSINKISDNYPKIPYSLVGYYRDYQLKDSLYLNLNEALLEVYDSGFTTIDQNITKTSIYDYKRNPNFPRDSITEKPYDYEQRNKTIEGAFLDDFGGNEFMILRIHDPIRNHSISSFDYVNILVFDFANNHDFKRLPDITFEDEKIFVVGITRINDGHRVSGKLFVSQNDFSIHKLEYALFRGGREVPDHEYFDITKEAKDKFFEVQVEYKPTDGDMYLNYISVSNSFRVEQNSSFKVNMRFMNWDDFCYEIHFSESPIVSEAIKPNKYRLRFKGKKVKIDRVEVQKEVVRLFPQLDGIKTDLNEVNEKAGMDQTNDFSLKVKNMRGVNGNRINQRSRKKIIQFREFFVQQVKPKKTAPVDFRYMRKNIPIFERQPVARPDNFDDYWMNTPLQKAE